MGRDNNCKKEFLGALANVIALGDGGATPSGATAVVARMLRDWSRWEPVSIGVECPHTTLVSASSHSFGPLPSAAPSTDTCRRMQGCSPELCFEFGDEADP